MTGERWPDKRARAVLYAGARGHAAEGGADADAVADLGLRLRAHLFVDEEVREETAEPKAHRIGYSRDCMQFATMEPVPTGVLLSLWLDPEHGQVAEQAFAARPHDNPFRKLYGWKAITVTPDAPTDDVLIADLVQAAAAHAAAEKARQSGAAAGGTTSTLA